MISEHGLFPGDMAASVAALASGAIAVSADALFARFTENAVCSTSWMIIEVLTKLFNLLQCTVYATYSWR